MSARHRRTMGMVVLMATALPVAAAAPARDALETAFRHPLVTDADLDAWFSDTHCVLVCDGGPVLIRYPGITGLTVDGATTPAEAVGNDLVRAEMPAGQHEVRALTGGPPPAAGVLAPNAEAVATPEAFAERAAGLGPSDELVVRDGIYVAWRVELAAEGAADRRVVIRAETPGGVIFKGDTRLRTTGRFITLKGFRFEHCGPGMVVEIRGGSDNRVTQCHFFGCGNPRSTFTHILEVGMASHRNRVDHCYFTSSQSMSIGQRVQSDQEVGTHNRFDHNLFRDIYRYWRNGQENIQLGGGQQRSDDATVEPMALVERNLFDHAWGDSEIISNKSSANTIRQNVAAHCTGSAFTLRLGDRVRFEGNVMVGNQMGLRVMGRRHLIANNLFLGPEVAGIRLESGHRDGLSTVTTEGTLIAHNTIVNCGGAGIVAAGPSDERPFPATGNTIAANILVGNHGTLLAGEWLRDTSIRGNIFHATGSAVVGDVGEGALLRDPLLTGPGVMTRPAPGSPAINAGVPMALVPVDRWGRARDEAPDLGADEVGAADPPGGVPLLPDLPPPAVVSPELYIVGPVLQHSPDDPSAGWREAGGVKADGDTLVLTDTAIEPEVQTPADIVMSWDYHPHEFASVAKLAFACDAEGNGYELAWGGVAQDGKPSGVISLSKTATDTAVAEVADIVMYYQTYRLVSYGGAAVEQTKPRDDRWYSFILIRRGATVMLLMRDARDTDVPRAVLMYRDRGVIGGEAPSGAGLRIGQTGVGSWRGMTVHGCEYRGDTAPQPPLELAAQARGGERVILRWRDGGSGGAGYRYDLYRSAEPNFAPSAADLVAAGVVGSGYDDFAVQPRRRYHYAVRAVNQLGLASELARVQVSTAADGPRYRIVPAAEAQNVRPPLLVAEDEHGAYLMASLEAGMATTGPPDQGNAELRFAVPEEGRYSVWGLALGLSGTMDSFWLVLDPGEDPAFRGWSTGSGGSWTWIRIVNNAELSAGAHRLRIKHREPGARLKALLVTDDTGFIPAAAH
jgi:poly(beta-D-mannuronate) lyase